MTAVPRELTLVPLDDLRGDPQNPKLHALPVISGSVTRFGFVEPVVVDGRTGMIISGHGRVDALREMRKLGEDPPEGCQLAGDGGWLVPVVSGWSSADDAQASAVLVALNRAGERGGWNKAGLAEVLQAADAADLLPFTGFTAGELRRLAAEPPEPKDRDLWGVIIETDTEDEQAELLERLTGEGYRVRALM